MIEIDDYRTLEYDKVPLDQYWNDSDQTEPLMHTIHAYPAKFPAFIATKAFDYAQNEGIRIQSVADIFCGCGTVALEAKRHGYDFWGCDINPVATLIARTKSDSYDVAMLRLYLEKIKQRYEEEKLPKNAYEMADERLKYWYKENSYKELLKIFCAIDAEVEQEKYREAFKCIFSAILKLASKWLTKSIKPQVDPEKKEIDVYKHFEKQCRKFIHAVEELNGSNSKTTIRCENFLEIKELPQIDLIVTSPPYVTSYEYADLHQLSSLWLKYTDDYRKLRKGSIGSIYNSEEYSIHFEKLNATGKETVYALMNHRKPDAKAKSVARYFIDMQRAVGKCYKMLNENGMVFFVIGDTEYKGVKILNSKHLIETLQGTGYRDIKLSKRTVSKGICVPYRDENGRFSTNKEQRKVYHEEFIVSGRK